MTPKAMPKMDTSQADLRVAQNPHLGLRSLEISGKGS
jgi:hypothetical protein